MADTSQSPDVYFAEKWGHLETGLNKSLRAFETQSSMTPKEWWTYHDACFHICIYPDESYKMADKLWPKISQVLEAFVSQQAVRLKDKTGEPLLREYLQTYQNYENSAQSVRKILTYIHRFWIPSHKTEVIGGIQVREVQQLSYIIWREKCYLKLKNQLLKAVLELLYQERTMGKQDMTLVRTLLHSFGTDALGLEEKGFYEREFEEPFLEATKLFYHSESSQYLEENGVTEYMKKAEARIEQEQGMARTFYLPQTEEKLKLALNESLIEKHMEALQVNFLQMLKDEKYEDMKRLCFLLSRITDGLNYTSKTFEEYLVKYVGSEIIESQKSKAPEAQLNNAVPFIQALISMQKKYTNLLISCFNNHPSFKAALDKAFAELMNRPTGKWTMPRLLTIFIDNVLKGKIKEASTDQELDDILDETVSLFGYLLDKDEFEEVSRKALCKRLLNTITSFNENWERALVAKLKAKHGDAFTRRLQGMFNDSQDETVARTKKRFEEWNQGPKVNGIQLSVKVLNECFWPLTTGDKIPVPGLPVDMANCVQKFEEFYKTETQNRKLKWIYNHGSMQLNSNFGKGKLVQLIVSPLQACVLLLFNNSEQLTFQEIFRSLFPGGEATSKLRTEGGGGAFDVKLDDQLKNSMSPLLTGAQTKFKLLLKAAEKGEKAEKETKTGDEEEGAPKAKPDAKTAAATADKLNPNDKLSVAKVLPAIIKKRKIVFPPGNAMTTATQAASQDQQLVQKTREFEADAAMVRVMKTKNVLKWNELQMMCFDALKHRFSPSVMLLKKRLESLIDRKFLERDPNDRNAIRYIA